MASINENLKIEGGERGGGGGIQDLTHEIGEKGGTGAHLELGELLGFVASVFGVEEFGEEELAQFGALAEDGRVGQRRPEEVDPVAGRYVDSVADVGRTRIDGLYNDERVQEVWCDHIRCERRVLFLEHHGHDIVTCCNQPNESITIDYRW